jgi:hypothetical protein
MHMTLLLSAEWKIVALILQELYSTDICVAASALCSTTSFIFATTYPSAARVICNQSKIYMYDIRSRKGS